MRVAFAVVASVICLALVGAGLVRAGEDPGQGIGMAIIFAFLGGMAWLVPFGAGRRKAMRRKLRQLAGELGATVRDEPHETILELTIEGQPATIAWGFVKWGKLRTTADALRVELELPAPLPRVRLINPRAFKAFFKRFEGEQRIALPKKLQWDVRALSPEPERVTGQLPPALFETAAFLLRRPFAVTPLRGDPAGWELWCEGTKVQGLLPNRWDMERVRGTLSLLELLVQSSRPAPAALNAP